MDITSYLLGKQAGGGGTTTLQNNKSVTINSNGSEVVNPDTGYDGMKKVTVTTSVTPNLESKQITIGTNTTTTITPTQGKDGLSSVEVTTNVPGIVPTGTLSITSNNTYDVTNYASAEVNVSGAGEPEKGFFATEWDSNGMATKYKVKNMQLITNMFTNYSSCPNAYIQEVIIEPGTQNITTIPASAFYSCEKLETINLPNTVTTIKMSAFSSCRNLILTELPSSLTTLETGAFYNCSKISITKIPDTVTSLPKTCFQSCLVIKKISMLNVTSMVGTNGGGSFYYCSGLKKVWIGSAITNNGLGRYVFQMCNALETIYIDLPRATVTTFTNYQYAFMDNTSKTGIIVCNDDAGFISKADFDALVVE